MLTPEEQKQLDEKFMLEALKQARLAAGRDEVPVGAVIVASNRVIARGNNQIETLNDVTAHAEMIAFTSAASALNVKYLHECTLYVTLEPCLMCAGASYWTQIDRIVYGAHDPKRGCMRYSGILHPKTEITGGVLEEECRELIQDFFRKKRN